MSMFIYLIKGAGKLIGIGNRNNEPPKVKLDEYNSFVKANYATAKKTRGVIKDSNAILAKEFKGSVESTTSDLNGRYLHSIVKKLNNSTVVLTGIWDRSDLGNKLSGKSDSEKGNYELTHDDLPGSEDLIGGYFLLVIHGNEKVAIQINISPEEKPLLDRISNATLQACSKSGSAVKTIQWLKDESDYRLMGSIPRGAGFLFGI